MGFLVNMTGLDENRVLQYEDSEMGVTPKEHLTSTGAENERSAASFRQVWYR